MSREDACPLTPALLELLQACADHSTTKASDLAPLLARSPETIRTEFKRTCQLLGVNSRTAALLTALRRGWIKLPPSREANKQKTKTKIKMSSIAVLTISPLTR